MIDKLERLLLKWFKAEPKDTYLQLLKQFESNDNTISNLPKMLVAFWERVDLRDFENGPGYRDMMDISIKVRHKSVSELTAMIIRATWSIAQEDLESVREISVNEFATYHDLTLDDYFSNIVGGSINFYTGVQNLRGVILAHGEVIENVTDTYYTRLLNRMYNDILSVTITIIENMRNTSS